jgi:hypothetical protein
MHRSVISRLTYATMLVMLALFLAACDAVTTEEPSPTEPPEAEGDQAIAEELWENLQGANYAEDWATVPGKGTLYPGQDPHGALISVYLNTGAMEALEGRPGQMPEGAIVVKDNYTADETLASVTVMEKQAGYDSDHNDWFWAKYGAEGNVQAAGKPDGCISCHGAVRSNDYVFTFPIAPIEADPVEPGDEVMTMAEELWEDLQLANYADDWTLIPGKGPLTPGQDPHGALISVYLNQGANQALQEPPGELPEGAVVLKENYMEDEMLASLTVMEKRADFDPDNNNWFWVKYGADGAVQAAGKPAGCISCHGAVRSNDYVFSFLVAPISPEGAPPEVD